MSLIDFDDAPSQATAPASSGAGGIDELASLFGPSPAPAPAHPPAAPNMGMGMGGMAYGAPMNAGMGGMMGFNGMAGMGGQQTPGAFQAPSPMASNGMGMSLPTTPNSHPPRGGTVSPSSGAPLGSIRLGTPQLPSYPQQPAQSPSYFGQPQQQHYQQPMQPMQPQQQTQTQAQAQPQAPPGGQQGKDPFADLVGLF